MFKQRIIPTCSKERYERTSKINREEENENTEREPINQEPAQRNEPTTQPVPPIQEPVEQPVQEPQQRETVPPTTNQPVQEPTTAPPEQPETTPNQGTTLDPTRFIFASTEPYPEITNAYPSMYEVKLIKWLAASRDSEMSAVATYMYQSYILQDEYPLLADTLKHIAIVEMRHLDLLSEAIVDFGGNPNLTDGRGNVWTGRNILQIRNPREILLADIKAEEQAIRKYQLAASKTCNASLAALFERIIIDEQDHIIILNELLSTL